MHHRYLVALLLVAATIVAYSYELEQRCGQFASLNDLLNVGGSVFGLVAAATVFWHVMRAKVEDLGSISSEKGTILLALFALCTFLTHTVVSSFVQIMKERPVCSADASFLPVPRDKGLAGGNED